MPDGKIFDYDGYLRQTLLPFTSAGIHLIATAPRGSMSAANFDAAARGYFNRISAFETARKSD